MLNLLCTASTTYSSLHQSSIRLATPLNVRNHNLPPTQVAFPLKSLKISPIGSNLTKLTFATSAKLFSRIASLRNCAFVLPKHNKMCTIMSDLTNSPCKKFTKPVPFHISICNLRPLLPRNVVQLLNHEKHPFGSFFTFPKLPFERPKPPNVNMGRFNTKTLKLQVKEI